MSEKKYIKVIALIEFVGAMLSLMVICYVLSKVMIGIHDYSYIFIHLIMLFLSASILLDYKKYILFFKYFILLQSLTILLDDFVTYSYYTPLQLTIGLRFEEHIKIFFDFHFGMNTHWNFGEKVAVESFGLNLFPIILYCLMNRYSFEDNDIIDFN